VPFFNKDRIDKKKKFDTFFANHNFLFSNITMHIPYNWYFSKREKRRRKEPKEKITSSVGGLLATAWGGGCCYAFVPLSRHIKM
jgi:hypothetical protein